MMYAATEASGDHGVAIGPSYDDGESYTTTRATDFATIAIGTAGEFVLRIGIKTDRVTGKRAFGGPISEA